MSRIPRSLLKTVVLIGVLVLTFDGGVNLARATTDIEQGQAWVAALLEMQAEMAATDPDEEALAAAGEEFSDWSQRKFPLCGDWCLQDAGADFRPWLRAPTMTGIALEATEKALAELGAAGPELRRWLDLYLRAAQARREVRLRNLRRQYPRRIFTKHYTLDGSHYAYTEGQSDAQHERHFHPGTACVGSIWRTVRPACRRSSRTPRASSGTRTSRETGGHVLFVWKTSDREDDYHLYEMAGPQELTGFHGPPRGFSFSREVQPILDRLSSAVLRRLRGGKCVGCRRQGEVPAFPGEASLHGGTGASQHRRMAEVARASCP